jgi:two-component system, chemotaxis family, chemotaxis protein CheY
MPAAAKVKAIIVDDQLTMRSLVRSALQQIGVTDIREFPSAGEAFQDLKAKPAHVVFSDFNMPGMDGLEFLRAIRAEATTKATAFILLTGRADKELVQRAAQFGANNYMVKPFTVAILKQKLDQIFGVLV